MDTYYTIERNVQILIALMKYHGVRRVIASPGARNLTFVASIQQDPFFEIYSSVDERSAAYMACGMAAESGEPVALSCTGSTASRDYLPGLTEAYYRKLPILAITSSRHLGLLGNAGQQDIDRSNPPADAVTLSVVADIPRCEEDERACNLAINRALIALRRNGGGPAHINLVTAFSSDFSVRELPPACAIDYIDDPAKMPPLDGFGRVAVLVGCHGPWSERLSSSVEAFCRAYDAVVLRYHASNYQGVYGVNHALSISTRNYESQLRDAELVIYIGSIPRYTSGMRKAGSQMWRVNPDGEIRDVEGTLTKVFAMEEEVFFEHYVGAAGAAARAPLSGGRGYARLWQDEYRELISHVPELPFSNVWVAQHAIGRVPEGAVLHLAGSNTARAWNFFELPRGVECYSNDGAMGIDGQVSALVGESLAGPGRLHLGVVGDLTFFYDMNSIGNRHVGPNLRLLVVSNGMGVEFRIYSNPAYQFGDDAKEYMAAAGHFGCKSPDLIRHYAEDLGFEYLRAATKGECLEALEAYLDPEPRDRPVLLEVFTSDEDENTAIYAMNHLVENRAGRAKEAAKGVIKAVAGDKGVTAVKRLLGR